MRCSREKEILVSPVNSPPAALVRPHDMKAAVFRRYGPPEVVRIDDYAKEDFTRNGETYDVILDAVGNCPFSRCQQALAPGGRLLLVVASLGEMLGGMLRPSRAGRQMLTGVGTPRREDLILLGELAESGALKPVIDRTYPLAQIADAHSYVDTGRKKGSVVITCA